MNTAVLGATPSLTPPDERHWLGPLLLALVAHALLVAALTWGISWKRDADPVAAQAELWSALPQSAAAREIDEAPPPPPVEDPPPKPTPSPQPTPSAEEQARADADIALQQQKKKREEALKAEAERQRHDKLVQEKLAREKAEKDKAEKEKADKAKAEKDKAREKAEADKNARAQQAELTRQRAENMKRMAGLAGASGAPGSTGTAQQSSGPSATYAGRIVAAVRPNIVFTDTVAGNPRAEVEVRTLPDGTIASRRIVKSSGIPAWDDAVLKALDRTARLPRDEHGKVPTPLNIGFSPKD